MANSLSTRRIPTLLGIVILAAGLIGGIFLANSATTGFLPRASPETTPKNPKVTNVTDSSFTVSWVTDSQTPGYVRYGTSPNNLTTTITDDRDQISGSVGSFRTHHVTLRSLTPSTTYYFKIGTGTNELYDDAGAPYQTSTVTPISVAAKTLYGEVLTAQGAAAPGALVYITADDIAPLSTITQASGSFVVSLAQARAKNGVTAAALGDDEAISLFVVSGTDSTTSLIDTFISQAQPVPDITLGTNQDLTFPFSSPEPASSTATTSALIQSKFTAQLLGSPVEASASAKPFAITVPPASGGSFSTSKPTITGKAPKSTTVTLKFTGPSTLNASAKADTLGAWKYTPTTALKNGTYTLTASTTIASQLQTETAIFSVILPTPTPKATTSGTVVNPSTESGELVSGNGTISLLFVLSGILFIGSGTFFSYAYQEAKREKS